MRHIEMIHDAWYYLSPIINSHVRNPSPLTEKNLAEEMQRFEMIMRGDVHGIISLFREALEVERDAHAETKRELESVSSKLKDLHNATIFLPSSPPSSPIPWEEESYE